MKKKLREEYESGNLGVVVPKENPGELCRFRKEKGEKMTGTMVGGEYVVVFWERFKAFLKDTEV